MVRHTLLETRLIQEFSELLVFSAAEEVEELFELGLLKRDEVSGKLPLGLAGVCDLSSVGKPVIRFVARGLGVAAS